MGQTTHCGPFQSLQWFCEVYHFILAFQIQISPCKLLKVFSQDLYLLSASLKPWFKIHFFLLLNYSFLKNLGFTSFSDLAGPFQKFNLCRGFLILRYSSSCLQSSAYLCCKKNHLLHVSNLSFVCVPQILTVGKTDQLSSVYCFQVIFDLINLCHTSSIISFQGCRIENYLSLLV